MRNIYFDNAATSFPKAPGLSTAVSNFIDNNCVNINRGVYSMSSELSDMVLETRVMLARLFDCDDKPIKFCKRIIFTSGVTQSINIFLRGLLKSGDHVVTSSVEHNAVMRTLHDLKDNCGVDFDIAKCNENGVVSAEAVEQCFKVNTKAVIINHASNVFSAINPIEEIGKLCKERDVFFAVDTAQTAGVLDVSMRKANIDFLAFSGHKGLLSVQGIGGFAISKKLSSVLKPIITGGTGSRSDLMYQPDYLPDKFESGTLNLCGIASLNHSLKYLLETKVENIRQNELLLREYFVDKLKEIKEAKVFCTDKGLDTVAVVSVDFIGYDNATVSTELQQKYGIMTRCGLHCAPCAHSAMGTYPGGTVRFSFSYFNTYDEIDYCIQSLKDILKGELLCPEL